jgi:hypothetical protein
MVGEEQLRMMKAHGLPREHLRGPIVDENAMGIKGRLDRRGRALGVYEKEPTDPDSPY